MSKLNVLFAAAEMRGLVSLGGLGEVIVDLAFALKRHGHDIRITLPFYQYFEIAGRIPENMKPVWQSVSTKNTGYNIEVYQTEFFWKDLSIPIYLIKGHPWFKAVENPEEIYCDEDAPEPYFYLASAILEFLNSSKNTWIPDVIHCHDYHTALLPVYLKTKYKSCLKSKSIGTMLTIHNLAFQGITEPDILSESGLSTELSQFSESRPNMEYYGKINCMKGGIAFADMISTVSLNYAKQIVTPQFGQGLHGILKNRNDQGHLTGILNGINNDHWNPEKLCNDIAYSKHSIEKKRDVKHRLQTILNLGISSDPIISIRSRWAYQKGIIFLIDALRNNAIHKRAQITVMCNCRNQDTKYNALWYELKQWATAFPDRIAIQTPDSENVFLQTAGSDFFLIPSLFEPCGLVPMEVMRYGTIHIAHKTGGLADIVSHDCGFSYEWPYQEPLNQELQRMGTTCMMNAVNSAIQCYYEENLWKNLLKNAMEKNHDWDIRVPEYEKVYQKTMQVVKRAAIPGQCTASC